MKRDDKIKMALVELNISEPPKCYCGNDLEFLSKLKNITPYGGWRTYCSKKCVYNSPEVKEKRKKTTLEKYGVESFSHIQERIHRTDEQKKSANIKRQQTHMKKYGVDHYSKTTEYLEKRKNTNLERYGVENTYRLSEPNSWFSTDAGKEWLQSDKNPSKRPETQKQWKLKRLSARVNDENFIAALMSNNKETFLTYIDSIATEDDNRFTLSKKIGISYSYLNNIFRMYDMYDHYTSPNNYSVSNGEMQLYEYVKSLGVKCIPSHRKLLDGYEVDVFIPDHNIAIEYNGLYWHSEYTGCKDRKYHLNKTDKCEEQGVQLFQIYDCEWNDPVKQNIWKSIISVKLGLTTNKIYARVCHTKKITSKESRKFLEENHLEGFVGAEQHFGLYHKDTLVSVMSFGKSRFKTDEYEIVRHATLLNTVVVGGRSKLLKCYTGDNLISYANRRFSSILTNNISSVYEFTEPSWYGFSRKDYDLKHRLYFQKHKMKERGIYDEDISLFDNMIQIGYDRIWDSGNIKFYI